MHRYQSDDTSEAATFEDVVRGGRRAARVLREGSSRDALARVDHVVGATEDLALPRLERVEDLASRDDQGHVPANCAQRSFLASRGLRSGVAAYVERDVDSTVPKRARRRIAQRRARKRGVGRFAAAQDRVPRVLQLVDRIVGRTGLVLGHQDTEEGHRSTSMVAYSTWSVVA
jgi:hypothetical protein